ncbi:hypothetical protein [Marinovum sp.]|uniref:hypothetical protein n=1 Tax=Marinovum sp. TaxID=2024839 RepID=UPI003A8ED6EA
MDLAGILLALVGVLLLLIVVADFLLVTISAAFFEVPSHRIASSMWRLVSWALPDRRWVRVCIGPVVMTSVASYWIIGTALAWTLIFQLQSRAIVRSADEAPAAWWMDMAYVGHLLSTLGGSLGKPGDVGWALAAVLVAVNGMVILTLSVSFVLNTTQAVSQGRAFLTTAELLDGRVADTPGTLADLATLIVRLNSVPMALYYSSPFETRRLPRGLVTLFRGAVERGDAQAIRAWRIALAELPRFYPPDGLDDHAYLDALERWSQQFEF